LCYLSFCPFLLAIVLSVLLSFSIGHCVICPCVLFYWPLCYLSFCPFLLAIVLSVLPSFSIGHCVICPCVLFYWPLCYLSLRPFLLAIVLSVLPSMASDYCFWCLQTFFYSTITNQTNTHYKHVGSNVHIEFPIKLQVPVISPRLFGSVRTRVAELSSFLRCVVFLCLLPCSLLCAKCCSGLSDYVCH
jgi:hypothetical protein